jgi:polysaccharide biosynthesis/export protein
MRPDRVAVLRVAALVTLAACASACSRQPGGAPVAQHQPQPSAVDSRRLSLDGLMWGPQGGTVHHSPTRGQTAYENGPGVAPPAAEPINDLQAYAAAEPSSQPAGPAQLPAQASAYQDGGPTASVTRAGAYQPAAYPQTSGSEERILEVGDQVRVTIHGPKGASGIYAVDASGVVTLPVGGAVQARGLNKDQFTRQILATLRDGGIRNPKVSVEMEGYRPFFIHGAVNQPGRYPFVPNMTVEAAVASAGGYSSRADRAKITLTRAVNGQATTSALPPNSVLWPGDTIEIAQRSGWF